MESYSASAALQAKPVIRSFHRMVNQWDMTGASCRARGLFENFPAMTSYIVDDIVLCLGITVRGRKLVSPG